MYDAIEELQQRRLIKDPHLPYEFRVIGVRHEDDEADTSYRDEVDADHDYHLV